MQISWLQPFHEPDCEVKKALEAGEISRLRYDDYLALYDELKEKRRYLNGIPIVSFNSVGGF